MFANFSNHDLSKNFRVNCPGNFLGGFLRRCGLGNRRAACLTTGCLIALVGVTSLAGQNSEATAQVETAQATSRPVDPWVFRCTLEGRPRMLVVALSQDVWLAFDTQDGKLIYAWTGDVEFTGTVYDTRHGPQPRVRGKPLMGEPDTQRHVIMLKDQTDSRDYRFVGYRFENNQVVLSHLINTSSGPVMIEETPEFLGGDHEQLTLSRKFVVQKLPDGASVDFSLGRFPPGTEISIDGTPQASAANASASVIHITQAGPIELIIHLARRE